MNYFYSILFILLLVPAVVHAEITRTLRLGDRGLDVRELQVILNSDPYTQIAAAGTGSPGNESTYFGALTKAAVDRLQIKYALEALTPAGLSAPTGIVGPLTRTVLYRLSRTSNTPMVATSPQVGIAPVLTSVSPQIITSSSQILTFSGSGFTPYNNQIIIASESEATAATVSSAATTTLSAALTFPTIEKMRSQLAYSGSRDIPSFVANLNSGMITKSNGVTYMRAILKIKNANGESNTVSILVDVASFLK